MRATFVLTVVLSAVVGLVSSGDAEPTQPPIASRVAEPISPALSAEPPTSPPAASPPQVMSPPAVPVYVRSPRGAPVFVPSESNERPDFHFHEGERQSLRHQYLSLAEKRAESMTRPELQRGIAELRRQYLISELAILANNSPDDFNKLQSKVAAAVLKAKDQKELETMIQSLATELSPREAVGQRFITPQGLLGTLIYLNGQNPSYLFAVARLLTP
jgi:hypothetical protein